jgi:sarcosine oxidase, subunit alpha
MSENGVRLPVAPAQQVDYSRKVTFYFEGQPLEAFAGETVAMALFAAGRRIFSRSFKYHRPRGLLCCSGDCPNCLMHVAGRPNQRACRVPVREGLRVSAQHAWPSLDRDLLNGIELFSRLMPVGFYYKTLYKPRFLWKLAEPVIRRLAGLGQIDINDQRHGEYEHSYEFTDLTVVGGGPAGIQAALCAARAGVSVTLIDGEARLGGHLCYQTLPGHHDGMPGYEVAAKMTAAVREQSNLRVLESSSAIGAYEGGLIPILQGNTLVHLRTRCLIAATGCHEYPLVFRNNDVPGVMLGRAALRMINIFGIRPGRRAVVVTANDHGYAVALECARSGIEIAEVVDARAQVSSCQEASKLRQQGIAVSQRQTVREVIGKRAVRAARLGRVDADGRHIAGPSREIHCDLVLVSTGWQPAASLLYQAGCRMEFDPLLGQAVPREFAPGVFAAGEVIGLRDLADILLSGEKAADAAIAFLNRDAAVNGTDDVEESLNRLRRASPAFSIGSTTGQERNFVCWCEDVVEKDLKQAVIEGYDEIETLKRYTTVSMGPCQGRMCARSAAEICAHATGKELRTIGTTTSRPPLVPVPLGALAGQELHPLKLGSIHYKHAALTHQMMNMGVWKRPSVYSSVQEEYDAVRNHAGLIDVSTLGKLVVKGRNAANLLDKVYTHWFSTLKPGRVRYGVICDESGTILDDGTVSRLAEDHYYITTSTGNVDFVEQWLKWWAAGTGWCVHVINATAAYAALNLAGPKAREVLSALTDTDLSPAAFPYMACAESRVAGIPALLLRIGFVGETGWEIHLPAECGEYLWDRLLESGREFGCRPFGVEAQRLLRLEKKHVIVGQDTDALSNPYEADMSWIVKLDKEDFVGRHALGNLQRREMRNRLVGFRMSDGVCPQDGNAVLIAGKLAGRVTSARFSPAWNQYVGLAWVPAEYAKEGTRIEVHVDGRLGAATIVEKPFYDPGGVRLT